MAFSNPLEELIAGIIQRKGPITFRDFMELCLYHPEYGYYARKRVGKEGDYYTSVSVGDIFGRTLAKQLEEMLSVCGDTVVEIGAGSGELAGDVTRFLKERGVSFRYVAVERMAEPGERGGVLWVRSLSELEPFEGVVISNELFDALPVHVVEVSGGRLKEVYVDWDGSFREVLMPLSTLEIEDYFDRLSVNLPEGYRTEVNLEAVKLLEAISSKLVRGFVLTMDYGYPSEELYAEYRSRGTLLCYFRHMVVDNPLINIGEQDMTSHVNFSALMEFGKDFGLEPILFTDQLHFLLSLGIVEEARTLEERLKVKTLIMPGGMGEIFKVLVQGKGVKGRLSSSRFLPGWGFSLV